MKRELLLTTLAIVCLFVVRAAIGQGILTPVNVDENGNGFILPTAGPFLIPSYNGPDPLDPANGLKPLIYDLGAVGLNNAVTGDLVLLETPPSGTNVLSDVVRFESTGTSSLLVFYSDVETTDPSHDLADVGLPPTLLTNQFVAVEQGSEDGWNGYDGYLPTPNQPGYIPGVVYNITSDVPEPATLGLLAVGAFGLAMRPTRRNGR